MKLQDRAVLTVLSRQLAVAMETVNELTRSSEQEAPLLDTSSHVASMQALKPFHRRGRALGPGRLYLAKQGARSMWRLDYKTHDGKRVRIALSEDRKLAEAKAKELILIRDMKLLGLDDQSGSDLQLRELRSRYLSDLRASATSEHLRNVTSRLTYVLDGIEAKTVGELRPIELMEYRNRHLERGASRRTANLDTDSMRAMLRWAVKVGLVTSSPIEKLPRLKETDGTKVCRRRAMTEREIEAFLRAAAEDDAKQLARVEGHRRGSGGERWQLRGRGLRVPQMPLWRCFLECGARYNETVRATWADVDFDERVLRVRPEHSKTGKPRELPLLDGMLDELRGLRELHPRILGRSLRDDDPVFRTPEGAVWPRHSRNIGRLFERLIDRAGIDRIDARGMKLDVHALRHSAATRYLRSGMPLQHAQLLLGHRDSRLTTSTYGHLVAQDLRASIERIQTTTASNVAQSA